MADIAELEQRITAALERVGAAVSSLSAEDMGDLQDQLAAEREMGIHFHIVALNIAENVEAFAIETHRGIKLEEKARRHLELQRGIDNAEITEMWLKCQVPSCK